MGATCSSTKLGVVYFRLISFLNYLLLKSGDLDTCFFFMWRDQINVAPTVNDE